jgi:predicted outer membrane repeat protein
MKTCLALLILLFSSWVSYADTFIVVNGNDSGTGSLREAIGLAPTNSVIKIEYSGVIDLLSPLVLTTDNLTIEGPAPIHMDIGAAAIASTNAAIEIIGNGIIIKGIKFSGKSGVNSYMRVQGTASATIEQCVFENNNISGGQGGAIFNDGNLVLSRCSFTNNVADNGGAIYSNGTLNVGFCSFHYCGNNGGNGGAIFSGGNLDLGRCTFFRTGSGTNTGGGIYLSNVLSAVKIRSSIFDSTSTASVPGTEGIGASTAASLMLTGNDITNCMMIDAPANLNSVIFGPYNNSVGAYPTNIFGLRSGGVITDGYGMQWIPVNNFAGTAIDNNIYNPDFIGGEDIRRSPSTTTYYSGAEDIGAVENSRYTIRNSNAGGAGSFQAVITAINAAGQGPYFLDFDYTGSATINITAPLSVFVGSNELIIDGYTLPLSRVPGPTDGVNPVVPAMANVVVEGPSSLQNAINIFSAGGARISGLTIAECGVGINIDNSQSLANIDVFGCHFGLNNLGVDNGKYCDTSIVIRNDYVTVGGDHDYRRNAFGGVNGPAKPHVFVQGFGFSSTRIEGNFFGLDAFGTGNANPGNGNIGVGFYGAGFGSISENVFGGLRKGIIVTGNSSMNIERNYFGLDSWGLGSMPIELGIEINGASGTSNIGGNDLANYFCSASDGSSSGAGVYIANTTVPQNIISNFFGFNKALTPVPNEIGVDVNSSSSVNIGLGSNIVNFIAASSVAGIQMNSTTNCIIQNAVLGLDTNGLTMAGYGNQIGINVLGSTSISIGVPGTPVWVCNSNSHGIILNGSSSCLLRDVNIGVDINLGAAGNSGSGIHVENSSAVNTIGGSSDSDGCIIANNGAHGISFSSGAFNNFVRNDSIYNHIGEGIQITGPTTQDILIEQTEIFNSGTTQKGIEVVSGANNGVPTPTILGASRCDGNLNVKVQFNNTIADDAQVEFFHIPAGSEDASGFGEGNTVLSLVPTNSYPASNIQIFTIPDVPAGDYISCVISYGLTNKNSSEFSNHSQVNELPTSSLLAQTDVNCFGETNGTISVTITGGTTPLTYDWLDTGASFATTQNVTGLAAGTFDLVVTDDVGCADTASYSITGPTSPVVVTLDGVNNVDCNGSMNGGADISVSGGTPGTAPLYYFDWDNDGTGDNDDVEDITGLNGGTYQVIVIDDNGCTDTIAGVNINEPAPISESSSVSSNYNGEDISCWGDADGSIQTMVSGGAGQRNINT